LGTRNEARGFIAFMRLSKFFDVDVEELALGHRRQRLGRLARQVGQHPITNGSWIFFSAP